MKSFVWLLFGALLVGGPLAGPARAAAQIPAELCTSITSDMEAVKQGLLPKGAV